MTARVASSSRSSAVKRLMQEAKELASPVDGCHAGPIGETELFDWHFTIRGPADTEFEGGIYHGRITLPPQYPFKPPDVMLLTPNGRFELNKKVCLNISSYHEESWQAAWGIRTALIALQSFFNTEAKGAIGGLDAPASERKRLAGLSREWTCPTCQIKNCEILPSDEPSEKKLGKQPEIDAPSESAQQSQSQQEKLDPITVSEAVVSTLPPGIAIPQTPAQATSTPQTPAVALAPASIRHIQSSTSAGMSSSSSSGNNATLGAAGASEGVLDEQQQQQLRLVEVLTKQLSLGTESHRTPHHDETPQENDNGARQPADLTVMAPGITASSPPPVWLDGAIGLVLVALASLLCRKML